MDKPQSLPSNVTSAASGSRQLGPRGIKRRPLPSGPDGYSSPTQVSDQSPAGESDAYERHRYTNSHPPPRPPKQHFVPETPDDVGYDLDPRFGPDSYQPRYGSNSSYPDGYHTNDLDQGYQESVLSHQEPELFGTDQHRPRPLPVQPTPSQPASEVEHFPSAPSSPYRVSDQSPYDSSSPLAVPPGPAQSLSWSGRTSTSPIKYTTHRDSPLRQSVSQRDMGETYPDPRFDTDDSPPPPPLHRGHIPRLSTAPAHMQDPCGQPPLSAPVAAPSRDSHSHPSPRTPIKFQSMEARSPLQRLEREYDPYQEIPFSALDQKRQRPAPVPYESSPSIDHDRYPTFPAERRKSNTNDIHQLRPMSSANDPPFPKRIAEQPSQQRYQEALREDFRQSTGCAPPQRAPTLDDLELRDERHIRRSDPVIVRPRAISPNPSHSIPRKSITPTPFTSEERGPSPNAFGPDSYDALNNATIPAVEDRVYKSPTETFEAARQKEVDKLRDQGPIIGNDGRVIDPSDHLPADTWAPEPERKQRKPEHVIKIRTKEEARLHRSGGSPPTSARPHSIATSPYYQSPYASSPHQSSPPQSPVPVLPQVESPGVRNRLRKPAPQRPLPVQPYPHPETSPAVPTMHSMSDRPSPASQRYTINSSPADGPLQRSPLSEYLVPAGSSYSPRSSIGGPPVFDYQPEYGATTPSSSPLDKTLKPEREYYRDPAYGGESPLALELSRIDIGPSRAR